VVLAWSVQRDHVGDKSLSASGIDWPSTEAIFNQNLDYCWQAG
jgi:hypothetical protein